MTLKEIAQELGVSPSTVSRVISGFGKNFTVTPELRKRILDRVAEHNYRPNQMYQAMRKKKNRQISIIMANYLQQSPDININAGVDAMNRSLYEKGFSFHYLIRPLEQRDTYGLPQWKVAGAVAVDVRTSNLVCELDASGLPYVVLNGVVGPRGSAVQTDDCYNMDCAMTYLYELGHRNIGYINDYRSPELIRINFDDQHYSVLRRTATYFEFCRSHGLPAMESAKDCSVTIEDAVEAGIAYGITAYVVYSFGMYMEICHHLRKRNLRVPEDVSVVTFNNMPMSRFSYPPATCVEIPVETMGIEAGRLLEELVEQPGTAKPQVKMFPGRLVIRESAAPVVEHR